MRESNNQERYAQKLLEFVRSIIPHDDYKEFQQTACKIDEAAQKEEFGKIHSQYPFLTDMFFHVIIAGLKSQELWLDWLWDHEISEMSADDQIKIRQLIQENNLQYNSLPQIASLLIQENFSGGTTNLADQIPEEFQNTLNDLKKLTAGNITPDALQELIISVKFQLKYIEQSKRKESLQYCINALRDIENAPELQANKKSSNLLRFFIEKFENIPINFCNDEEYKTWGVLCEPEKQPDNKYFEKLQRSINEAHQEHTGQARKFQEVLARLENSDSSGG